MRAGRNMNGAGRPAHLPGIAGRSKAPLWLGDDADLRQDHSAPRRTGVWRHHSVHPLCAVAGRAGREGHLRSSAGVAAAVVRKHQLKDITVIAAGEPLPAFDLHCPLLSLPLAFGTQPETIPAAVPYLAAPAERLAYWRDRLPPGRPRAGFVWSGQSSHKNDSNRSIALRAPVRIV